MLSLTMPFNYEQSIWGRGTASLRWGDPTAFRLRQALGALRQAPRGSKVLELGCGAGQFIRGVNKLRSGFACHGSDISRAAISLAQKNNDGVAYAVSASERLPYADNFFDAVLVFDVLEHVPNPAMVLNEARRVLKSGGLLYAFVPCEGDWTSFWHALELVGLKRNLTKKYAGHINYFSRWSLRELLTGYNFKIARARYSEHFIGQLLGIAAFILMDRAAKRPEATQINNEEFFELAGSRGIVKWIKNFVNTLIYAESTLLQRLPSPNIHLTAKKI